MINVYKEMNSTDFENLLKQIDSENDIENAMIILQLIQLNLEMELAEEEKKKQEISKPKKELKSKIDFMIAGFLARPAEFLGMDFDIDKYVEEKTGYSLLPKTKEERQIKADNILKKIAEVKLKKVKSNENIKETKSKKELKEKLRKVQKELEKKSVSFE